MTKDEKSLLMFFEDIAVNQWGVIDDPRKMNADDFEIMKRWDREKFVISKEVSRDRNGEELFTHSIRLSKTAWKLAHKLRKEKALRHIPDEVSLIEIKNYD